MNQIIGMALSGLQAAAKRLHIGASNVANMANRGRLSADDIAAPGLHRPRQVVQVATPHGGVRAFARPVDPAFHVVPDPSAAGGGIAMPNVDPGEKVVEMIVAKTAYRANAAVIAVAQELDQVLLDIKA